MPTGVDPKLDRYAGTLERPLPCLSLFGAAHFAVEQQHRGPDGRSVADRGCPLPDARVVGGGAPPGAPERLTSHTFVEQAQVSDALPGHRSLISGAGGDQAVDQRPAPGPAEQDDAAHRFGGLDSCDR